MDGDCTARLHQIIAALQRRWGTRALRRLSDLSTPDSIPVIPTSFADLDAALHIGGVPRGRLTGLLGTPTSGMTTIALSLLARAQGQGDVVGYIDLSRTFDPEYAATVGVDLAALLLVRPPAADDALHIIQALIGCGGIGVLLVASLALLQTKPRDAALLSQALCVLPGLLAASPCALIALTLLPYSPAMIHSFSRGDCPSTRPAQLAILRRQLIELCVRTNVYIQRHLSLPDNDDLPFAP